MNFEFAEDKVLITLKIDFYERDLRTFRYFTEPCVLNCILQSEKFDGIIRLENFWVKSFWS